MGEKRAVQVSHELWRQMMTQGHTSAGVRCIEGIPEDARLVQSFAREEQFTTGEDGRVEMRSDPVFVFESDNWSTPTPEYTVVNAVREVIPVFSPVFRVAECRTCKWWKPDAIKRHGECILTEMDDLVIIHESETDAFALAGGDGPHPGGVLMTRPGFGCTQYEPRDTQ